MEVGLTEKQAFNILGWNYSSKEELFSIHDKNDIVVTPYDKFESIVFNTNGALRCAPFCVFLIIFLKKIINVAF
jgi:hypothetical protein